MDLHTKGGPGLDDDSSHDDDDHDDDDDDMDSQEDEDDDEEDDDDYSLLYNPETRHKEEEEDEQLHLSHRRKKKRRRRRNHASPQNEQSSFPSLVFLAIHSDGSHPDVREVIALEELIAIENVMNHGMVKLVFRNGGIVEIDCNVNLGDQGHGNGGGSGGGGGRNKNALPHDMSVGGRGGIGIGITGSTMNARSGPVTPFLQKNRFLWSLLQIHAISSTGTAFARVHSAPLPQLTMRNVDRAELQYISTVNGFLSDNPVLCALLERQRNLNKSDAASTAGRSGASGGGAGDDNSRVGGKDSDSQRDRKGTGAREEESKREPGQIDDEMDGIAYDMIMGNFGKLTLFLSEEEKCDAEEVLNTTIVEKDANGNPALNDGNVSELFNLDDSDIAENLMQLLQKRMRDLEAETCRRLIAWEDEKKYSISGNAPTRRDTMEAQSLSSLFEKLDELDKELEDMEDWLLDKAVEIKPLTDDCREVEEVNRELDQQKFSYELLSIELGKLLDGLEVEPGTLDILMNPTSHMVYHKNGDINLKESEPHVEQIYHAGKALKMSFDKVQEERGVHLRAVSERVEGLLQLSTSFCEAVAGIMVAVMKRTIVEVGDADDSKNTSHAGIAKSIRGVSSLGAPFASFHSVQNSLLT